MWKSPGRPDYKVTQTFNSGVLTVYTVTDAARPGYQPAPELREKIKLPYEERRLGIQRYYDARQNQTEISRVLRIPHAGHVSNLDTVITEDGVGYRIDLIQAVTGVFPPCDDITLVKYTQEELNDLV